MTSAEELIHEAVIRAVCNLPHLPTDDRLPQGLTRATVMQNLIAHDIGQLDRKLNGDQAARDDRPVYFIQAGNGLIKIGVAENPERRLRALQTSSPSQLRLLATLPTGGLPLEAELHERFASARSHGEWFRPVPELLAFIEQEGTQP